MRLLVIEDDPDLNRQLATALTDAGYVVDRAFDGEEGHYLGETEPYDAIILDIGLPKMDGISVLEAWRRTGRAMPVLLLTARDRWSDKVQGFDAGADDYVAKPFHLEEVLARIRALLRRSVGHAKSEFLCGPVRLDSRTGRVTVDGTPVKLTSHEYRLLSYLMHHTGRVVSRTELVEHLYDQDFDRDSNTIEVFVGRIRKKLGVEIIQTVRGLGYLLTPPADARYVSAQVIANSGGAFVRMILINAGTEDHIARGQAAITGEGLVGRLTEVGDRAARVLLITDLNSRIPVTVERSHVNAVLAGDNSERPRLLYLPPPDGVKVGDRIVTSGEGGVFPPGLPVGVVGSLDAAGPRVEPYVELSQIGYVLVVDYGLSRSLPQPPQPESNTSSSNRNPRSRSSRRFKQRKSTTTICNRSVDPKFCLLGSIRNLVDKVADIREDLLTQVHTQQPCAEPSPKLRLKTLQDIGR